jgi:hypothetical protein
VGVCLVILDEDAIDNGTSTIERAAADHGVTPDFLVNDDDPSEVGNPPLRWNQLFPGDVALIPAGQVDDEGWFTLPDTTDEEWVAAFAAGTLPQNQLDRVPNVMPLRNQDLVRLIGRTCVGVVYDSDISIDYQPLIANLQGARYGRFTFTVLGIEVPGSIPESQSSTSLYDLWLRVEAPLEIGTPVQVVVRDHEPDSIQTTRARYNGGTQLLEVFGTSNFAPGAVMTLSVDGPDAGTDLAVDPFLLEAPMSFNPARGRYELILSTPVSLRGRRIVISTDEGGSYNDVLR